jgi:hypothetical protein
MKTAVDQLIEKMSLEDVCKYSNELAEAKEMEKEHKIEFALTVYSEIVETDKDFVDVIKSMNL